MNKKIKIAIGATLFIGLGVDIIHSLVKTHKETKETEKAETIVDTDIDKEFDEAINKIKKETEEKSVEELKNLLAEREEEIEGLKAELEKASNQLKAIQDNEDFQEWMSLKTSFKLHKDEFSNWLNEKTEKELKEQEESIVKKAIEEKDWDTVYNKTEHWYNHVPCQMGRYEVFRYLREDGFVTEEQVKVARKYFGNLWNYVGD